MIYLFYGINDFLINRKIKKIEEENNINSINISNYNLDTDILDNILEDASMVSLFSEKKLIIIDNSYIFTGTIKKKGLEHNIDNLIKYINNPNPETILIFKTDSEKIDDRKKIVKLIKEKGNVTEFSKPKSLDNFIIQELDNYKMDSNTIKIFINYVGDNLSIIAKEIDKLKLYKDDNYVITKHDIYNICSESTLIDLNDLTNSIINKNISKSLKIYNEMLNQGEEPIQIIIRLANQFRIIYQAKMLSKKGYSNKDITNILGIHPYRIQKALENSINYSSQKLLNYIKKLANIDECIKSGTIDKYIALELFILEI